MTRNIALAGNEMFVVDRENHRIQVLDLDGNFSANGEVMVLLKANLLNPTLSL